MRRTQCGWDDCARRRRYAAGLMSASPVSASLALRRCVGLSVTITSSVGRTWAVPRCPALALPSRVPSTIGARVCLLGFQQRLQSARQPRPARALGSYRMFSSPNCSTAKSHRLTRRSRSMRQHGCAPVRRNPASSKEPLRRCRVRRRMYAVHRPHETVWIAW
jgi:hypothetical protein